MKYEILNCLTGNDFIVYGTGSIAQTIIPHLYALQRDFQVLGVAVTKIESVRKYENTPLYVRSIDEWAEMCPKAAVLIATSDLYHDEITQICKKKGFQKILPVTPELREAIINSFFEEYLYQKNINLDGKYLNFGSIKIINPLKLNLSNRADIFTQLGDLIFPHIYPDWNIFGEGAYDPDGVLELQKDDIVLDCGANMGTFSAYAASKGCVCYAFEPTPELLPVLRQYSSIYENKIIPVECAVSDTVGSTQFHLNPYASSGNSLSDIHPVGRGSILVKQITLDSFVNEYQCPYVSFIKADIEGAERMMLAGAQQVLKEFGPKLSLCTYHLPDDKEVLTDLILKANPHYRIEYGREKLYAYIPKEDA